MKIVLIFVFIILGSSNISFAKTYSEKNQERVKSWEKTKNIKIAKEKKEAENKRKESRTLEEEFLEDMGTGNGSCFYYIVDGHLTDYKYLQGYINEFGYFEATLEIIQIIDKEHAIVNIPKYEKPNYVLNINTDGMCDGSIYSFKATSPLTIIGTYSYITVLGAKRTLPLITPVDISDKVSILTFEIYKYLIDKGFKIPPWKTFYTDYVSEGKTIDISEYLKENKK